MLSRLLKDWKRTMAVNILGTVEAQNCNSHSDTGPFLLPSFTSFCGSVEPLSKDAIFQEGSWELLYKYTEAGSKGNFIVFSDCRRSSDFLLLTVVLYVWCGVL